MRSQTLALSMSLFLTSMSFAGTLLTQESAPKLDLKMQKLVFKQGHPIKSLGKFKVNNREISCRIADSRAEKFDVRLTEKDLKKVRLVSHFPDKGVVKLEASGLGAGDPGIAMECTYQAIAGKKANSSPISVEDFQSYFNQYQDESKWVSVLLDTLPIMMESYVSKKAYIREDYYSKAYSRKSLRAQIKKFEEAEREYKNSSENNLSEASNPQACPDPNRAEKISDRLLQQCTSDSSEASSSAGKFITSQGHR